MRIISEQRMVITPQMMNHRTYRIKPHVPRSPGVHVQAVNKALGIAAGKLSDSNEPSFPFEPLTLTNYPLMMALGVFWEEGRASMFEEHELAWSPGELERDGLFGTPDGYMFTHDQPCSWECKRTTKKIQPIRDMWMYLKQGLSYFAMGTPGLFQYDILWVMGDYTRPFQPIATTSLVEFSKSEAEAWWAIVLKAAPTVEPEG